MKRIKAVITDLGGVLFEGGWGATSRGMAKKYPDFPNLWEKKEFIELENDSFRGEVTPEEYRKILGEILEHKYNPDEVRQTQLDVVKPVSGMSELFVELKKAGYKVGIISGIDEETLDTLKRKYSFLEEFDASVISYEMGANKPDDVMYKTACERLGIKPEEAIYIDNELHFLKPAEQLGMKTLHVEKNANHARKGLKAYGVKLGD